LAFYGIPEIVYIESEFIELKDLQEFFHELVPSVSVGSQNKNPYIFLNGQTSLLLYPPLILVDNIPVASNSKLLSIPSSRINRIEIINRGYVAGGFRYSGIVSIFSKEHSLAADLVEDPNFFNYQLFSEQELLIPDYAGGNNLSTRADRRNVLYWDPFLEMKTGEQVKIRFYTSDAPGDYQVCIRSLKTDGGAMTCSLSEFTVR
jgi:hypothetical protein